MNKNETPTVNTTPAPASSRGNSTRRQRLMTDGKKMVVVLVEKFVADRTMSLSASLAFYAILSLAPLSVLILFGFSQLNETLVDRFIQETNNLIGYSGGSAVELAIRSAQDRPRSGGFASLISLVVILVSSGAMFGELRESLSIVLRADVRKRTRDDFLYTTWQIIRDRLLSTGYALTFVLILVISLVLSALLSAFAKSNGMLFVELPVSFVIYTGIFAMLFMYGTYHGLKFRDALRGAVITSTLFLVGKTLIGLYIGNSSVAGSYGAAGSVVALLVWIFYASLIVFTGAQVAWLLSPRGKAFMEGKDKPAAPPQPERRAV